MVWIPNNKFQVRGEVYLFQPYQSYVQTPDGGVEYEDPFTTRFIILSSTIVYNTLVGPLSMSVNYYSNNDIINTTESQPVTLLLNFGYIIFNKRAYK